MAPQRGRCKCRHLSFLLPQVLRRIGTSASVIAWNQMRVIEARYEKGLLKPREPLALGAGETVGLIIVRRPDPKRWNIERLRESTTADEATLTQQGLDDWTAALDKEDSR